MNKKFGVWTVVTALVLAVFSPAQAGGGPAMDVYGTRGQLVLHLSQEPTDARIWYYQTGTAGEHLTNLDWVKTDGPWVATVDTRNWTAFKVRPMQDFGTYIHNPFWQDAEPDETGWIERSIVTPTLVVSGTAGTVELTAWGIWGDEDLEYWELGVHKTLDAQWEEICPDTYQVILEGFSNVESFKVMTWPDPTVVSLSANWATGNAPGWVVQVEPPPPPPPVLDQHLYLPFVGR